jgi:hypothetical protein
MRRNRVYFFIALFLLLLAGISTGCGAGVQQVIPTARPSATASHTPTLTRTPDPNATPTPIPTSFFSGSATFGPSPTSLFGPTSTAVALLPTNTRVVNPNAPRIEFFRSDPAVVSPGDPVTLFWSTRGTSTATIYRIERDGQRGNLWNVPPDGSLPVPTRRSDRGAVRFLLTVGDGDLITEQLLDIAIACPDSWFFQPPPNECPAGPSIQTGLIEQNFERGRMVFINERNRVYALFNDGREPGWVSFENQFNPATDPELDENFERALPPGFVQPLRRLGFVWRGNDTVRNRLGLGLVAETVYDGFIQTVTDADGQESLYISSSQGEVLQLLPRGEGWQIISPR